MFPSLFLFSTSTAPMMISREKLYNPYLGKLPQLGRIWFKKWDAIITHLSKQGFVFGWRCVRFHGLYNYVNERSPWWRANRFSGGCERFNDVWRICFCKCVFISWACMCSQKSSGVHYKKTEMDDFLKFQPASRFLCLLLQLWPINSVSTHQIEILNVLALSLETFVNELWNFGFSLLHSWAPPSSGSKCCKTLINWEPY